MPAAAGHRVPGRRKIFDYRRLQESRRVAAGPGADGFLRDRPPPLDARQAGLLRIELNGGRDLRLAEKLLFIGWLKKNCGRELYRRAAALLRLSATELHDFEELLHCGTLLLDAVATGALDITVAPEMAHLSDTDAGALITLFAAIRLSRQMQRELAEWLPEIAFNRRIPLPELIECGELGDIRRDTRLNNPQKAAHIHGAAYEMRFPLYTRTKNAWNAHSRRLNPDPSSISFHPAAYFEKNLLEIRIKVGDGASLHELMGKLAEIDTPDWWKLIDPARIGPEV